MKKSSDWRDLVVEIFRCPLKKKYINTKCEPQERP